MSGTFPSSVGFTGVNFRAVNFNLSSESTSGRVQVRNRGGQKFAFTASFPPMKREDFGPIDGFMAGQSGSLESFQIVIPVISYTSGNASGSVTANGGASAGATSTNIAGLSGIMKAGDVFKFNGHSKVYKVTEDRASSGALNFSPPLVQPVSNGQGITYTAVPFTVRMANDIVEWGADKASHFIFELDLIEAT
jgi:hypothetical protein